MFYYSNVNWRISASLAKKDCVYRGFTIVKFMAISVLVWQERFDLPYFYQSNTDCSNFASLSDKSQFTMVLPW